MKKIRMKNKYVTVVLAILMAAVFLLGCAGKDADNNANEWLIKVMDENGKPVEGVNIQMCTDELCIPLVSNAIGEVPFDGKESSYELHVGKLPEGYSYDNGDIEAKKGQAIIIKLSITEK